MFPQNIYHVCTGEFLGEGLQGLLPWQCVAVEAVDLKAEEVLVNHAVGHPDGKGDDLAAYRWSILFLPEEPRQHSSSEAHNGGTTAEDVAGAVIFLDSLLLHLDNPLLQSFVQPRHFHHVFRHDCLPLQRYFAETCQSDIHDALLLGIELAPYRHWFAELVGQGDEKHAGYQTVLDIGIEPAHGLGRTAEERIVEEIHIARIALVAGIILAVEAVVEADTQYIGER